MVKLILISIAAVALATPALACDPNDIFYSTCQANTQAAQNNANAWLEIQQRQMQQQLDDQQRQLDQMQREQSNPYAPNSQW